MTGQALARSAGGRFVLHGEDQSPRSRAYSCFHWTLPPERAQWPEAIRIEVI
jgi:hypothetical protein